MAKAMQKRLSPKLTTPCKGKGSLDISLTGKVELKIEGSEDRSRIVDDKPTDHGSRTKKGEFDLSVSTTIFELIKAVKVGKVETAGKESKKAHA